MKKQTIGHGLAVLWVLTACEPKPEATEPLLRSVRYVVVKGADKARGRTFSGKVRAGNQNRLSFQVGGRVKDVLVKVGDAVKKGDRIAAVDATDFEIQIQEARASAAQARAQSQSASANYERVRALYERRNASTQDLDNARAQRDSTRSLVSAASQTVKRLQRQVEYATLKASADGAISEMSIEPSEVVSPGQVIGLLQVGDQLEVGVDLPESQIGLVEQGSAVTVRAAAAGEQPLVGTVHEIGVPSAGGALFPVSIRLGDGSADKVRTGMVAEVTFAFAEAGEPGSHRNLPLTAVGEDRAGRFVYVVDRGPDETGTVKRRSVEVDGIEGDSIEVVSGVEDGELVVTLGVNRIHDGLKVKVPPL